MTPQKVYCKDCKWFALPKLRSELWWCLDTGWGTYDFKQKGCENYRRKWWKFWVRK